MYVGPKIIHLIRQHLRHDVQLERHPQEGDEGHEAAENDAVHFERQSGGNHFGSVGEITLQAFRIFNSFSGTLSKVVPRRPVSSIQTPDFFTAVKAVVKSKPDLDGGGGKNVYFLHSQTKSSGDTLLSKFSTKLFPPSFV
jgi:hypothetical protein